MTRNEDTKTPVGAQLAARILDVGSASADLGFGGLKSALQRGIGIALAALFLATPNAALADNECGVDDPTINGALADSYDCPDADYPEGVTYAADGDLTVNFTNGGVTTIGENPDNGGDDPQPGDDLTDRGGIDLSATGGDSIVFDSATTGTEIESNGVLGALLSVTTVDGSIHIDTAEMDADESAAGVTHGIFAESTGSGSIDINATGKVDARRTSNPDTSIGIEAIAGSGGLTITVSDRVDGNASAIRAVSGGDAVINVGAGGGIENASGSTEAVLDVTATSGTTVNNAGSLGSFNRTAIRAGGGALALNNDGSIQGALDFSGLNEGEGYIFNNNAGATWNAQADKEKPGDLAGDLGAGEFNNAGTISLQQGDVISAPGTTFTGSGESTIRLTDVILDGQDGQLDCSAPTVAACLDLSGGATAGQTDILVVAFKELLENPFTDVVDKPVSPGIVLVDVGGGTSQADHFVLHPDSFKIIDTEPKKLGGEVSIPIYAEDPKYGAVLDTGGLFDYTLLYNPDSQQHILASVPQKEGVEYVAFVDQALSIWHTTGEAVAARQADLQPGGDRGGWVRVVGEQTARESTPTLTTHGNSFTYDQDYSLYTGAIVAGADVASGDTYVIGLHGGLISARATYDDSSTRNRVSGVTAGAYGSWWQGNLRVDGAVNANFIPKFDHSVTDQENSTSNVKSYGLRAEAGWRLPLMGEALYVQPLATAAYVSANIDSLRLRDYDLNFQNADSTRAGMGARLGGETDINGDTVGRLAYWLTARAWEEYAGDDANVTYAVEGGEDLVIEDDISGTFEEIGFGVEATNPEGNFSAYLSAGAKFADETDNYNISVGARMNW